MKSVLFAAAITITAFVAIPSVGAQSFSDLANSQSAVAPDAATDWWSGVADMAPAQTTRASRPTSSQGYAPRFVSSPTASASFQMAGVNVSTDFVGEASAMQVAASSVSGIEDAARRAVEGAFAKARALASSKPKGMSSMKVPPQDRGWGWSPLN